MRLRFSVTVLVVVLTISACPLWAHHGWSGNSDQEFEITGTVEKGVSLAGRPRHA